MIMMANNEISAHGKMTSAIRRMQHGDDKQISIIDQPSGVTRRMEIKLFIEA